MNTRKLSTRMLVSCGMLAAVAFVLQYIEFSIPIMPSFIKLDLSDLPEIIGAFAFGPVAGVIIALVKNLIHLPFGSTGGVGELSNFILGAVFAASAGAFYQRGKSKKTALIGGIIGAAAMAVVSLPSNYFIVYPVYYNFMPKEVIVQAYQAIFPGVNSIFSCLLVFNVPFTLVKGLLCVLVAMLIYKPLSPILKGRK